MPRPVHGLCCPRQGELETPTSRPRDPAHPPLELGSGPGAEARLNRPLRKLQSLAANLERRGPAEKIHDQNQRSVGILSHHQTHLENTVLSQARFGLFCYLWVG